MTQDINAGFITSVMERLYHRRPSHVERLNGGVKLSMMRIY